MAEILILNLIILVKDSKALEKVTKFSKLGAFLLLLFLYPIGTIVAQVQEQR